MLKSRSARGSENCTLASYIMPPTHDTDEYRRSIWSNSLNIGTGNFFGRTGNFIRGTGNYLGGSGNRPTVRLSVKLGTWNRLFLQIFTAGMATIR